MIVLRSRPLSSGAITDSPAVVGHAAEHGRSAVTGARVTPDAAGVYLGGIRPPPEAAR